ncbi:transcription elongation factor subunit Spt4 [Nanoarchaeota archaeon]
MKKKVCKTCRVFVEGGECPICKGTNFSTNWQGRLSVTHVEKSKIAQKMAIKQKGEYAVKCR